MTVNEPVALPLCSLTVVRETIKGREQGASSELSQERLMLSGCYISPRWWLTDPAPWEFACLYLCVSGLGVQSLLQHRAPGL